MDKSRATTLVMLSGGLDSTTLLYKLLLETSDDIHVHYVHYLNVENRADCEQAAVNDVVQWCYHNVRPFVFSRNISDFRFLPYAPWDYQILSFVAGQICVVWQNIDKVAFGLEANEIDRTLWGLNWTHARHVFDVTHRLTDRRAEWIFPIKDMSRKEEFGFIPRELYDLTWSCRTPTISNGLHQPCLTCRPCEEAVKQKIPLQPPRLLLGERNGS